MSAVSLGSWKTYGGGGISDEQARECIETAFVCGINFIENLGLVVLAGNWRFVPAPERPLRQPPRSA